MIYQRLSKRQLLAMLWWQQPRFRDRDATVPALRTVLGYMRTNGITSAGVSVLRAPINARGDVR